MGLGSVRIDALVKLICPLTFNSATVSHEKARDRDNVPLVLHSSSHYSFWLLYYRYVYQELLNLLC